MEQSRKGERVSIGAGGDNDLVKIYNQGRTYSERLIMHPNFNLEDFLNDIALIKLEKPLELSQTVLPGCLDTEKARKSYGDVVITGYGLTSKPIVDRKQGREIGNPSNSRFLKELGYKDISESDEKCRGSPGILCVDSQSGIKESGCYGDSGKFGFL